jgi:hypothetical protein
MRSGRRINLEASIAADFETEPPRLSISGSVDLRHKGIEIDIERRF